MANVSPPADAPPAGPAMRPEDLVVVLRREETGPELDRERVVSADVLDIFSELWLSRWLRRNCPDVAFEKLSLRIVPTYGGGPGRRCAGFQFQAADPMGRTAQRDFVLDVFQDVAARGSQRLLANETLKADDVYYYEVIADPQPAAAEAGAGPAFKITAKNQPLVYREVPLLAVQDRARQVDKVDDRWMKVFFTRTALAAAERYSRRGGGFNPPEETGAVLVGPLCYCPNSGEMFAVVTDALEVKDAEGSSFSLSYTSQSWQRIQVVMQAWQDDPARRAYRILGQAHGHNFRADFKAGEGHGSCDTCPKLKTCRLTSVFVSQDDRNWTRAVFSRQPWQLGLIFGHDARNGPVHALFGLQDNRLTKRGYYVIPDFNPEEV